MVEGTSGTYSSNGALHWNNFPNEAKIAESVSYFESMLNKTIT